MPVSQSDHSNSQFTSWLEAAKLAAKLTSEHKEDLQAKKSRFNIFKALGVARYEVPTSKFICYLLNPKETHDCGEVFLNLLVEVLRDVPPLPAIPGELIDGLAKDAFERIKTEEYTSDGRKIDIVAHFKSHVLGIENKIDAGDQEDQVSDYARYLGEQAPKQHLLLYLTLDGRESNSANDQVYYRISYQEHIRLWLERCIGSVKSFSRATENLQQFLDVVLANCDSPIDKPDMQKMKTFILQNPELINQSGTLLACITDIQLERVRAFLTELGEEIKVQSGGQFTLEEDSPFASLTDDKSYVLCGWKGNSFSQYKLFFEHEAGSDGSPLCMGFSSPAGSQENSEWSYLDRHKEQITPSPSKRRMKNWPANWSEFDSPFTCSETAKLLDEGEFRKRVKSVACEIVGYAQNIEKLLEQYPFVPPQSP